MVLHALAGCSIVRPEGFGGAVEIVSAGSVARVFPTHVSGGLGVCTKTGAAHEVTCDGKRRTYPADALCVRAPGCVWSCEAAPVGFLSIDVAPSHLPEDLAPHSMRFLPANPALDLPRIASQLCSSDALLREQTLVELILALVDREALGGARATHAAGSMERARQRLHAQLDRALTLDELAADAGINKFVLIRRFRAELGATPHQYRTLLRIEQARVQLARGVPLTDVALALGFADQPHFSRAFKRVLGVTPGAYAQGLKRKLWSMARDQSLRDERRP